MTPASTVICIFVVAVTLFVTGRLPMGLVALSVPIALHLAGVIEAKEIFASVTSPSIILVLAMGVVGSALFKTGMAAKLGKTLFRCCLGERSLVFAVVLLGVLWVAVWALTQLMSNTATCALFCPIGWSVATSLGADPRAVVISVLIASSVGVCTPLAIPANMLILEPGNLRFRDFFAGGLAVSAVAFVLSMLLLPRLYPFFP